MARTSVSIEELKGVMEKAGLRVPSFDQRDVETVGTQEAIASQVRGEGASAVEQMKKKYMDQINKIAQMDSRLAGVYSDPASKLYIEHPLEREKIYAGAADIGYKAAGSALGGIEDAIKNTEDKITSLTSLYNKLLERKNAAGGGGVGGDELAALQAIFPGMKFSTLEEILGGGNQAKPSLQSFDNRPPLQSFDNNELGVDILRQPMA